MLQMKSLLDHRIVSETPTHLSDVICQFAQLSRTDNHGHFGFQLLSQALFLKFFTQLLSLFICATEHHECPIITICTIYHILPLPVTPVSLSVQNRYIHFFSLYRRLGKTLNPKLLPLVRPAPCVVAHCHRCVSGCMNGWMSSKNLIKCFE